jgi:hypothetical protein
MYRVMETLDTLSLERIEGCDLRAVESYLASSMSIVSDAPVVAELFLDERLQASLGDHTRKHLTER